MPSIEKTKRNSNQLLDAELSVVKATHELKRQRSMFDITKNYLDNNFVIQIGGSIAETLSSKAFGANIELGYRVFNTGSFGLTAMLGYNYLNYTSSVKTQSSGFDYNYYTTRTNTTDTKYQFDHLAYLTLNPSYSLFENLLGNITADVYGIIGIGFIMGKTEAKSNEYIYGSYLNKTTTTSSNQNLVNVVFGGGVNIMYNNKIGLNVNYKGMNLSQIGTIMHTYNMGLVFKF